MSTRMGLWRAEAAGRNFDRSHWDISTGGRESPGKGDKVQQGVGWGGVGWVIEALTSIIHTQVKKGLWQNFCSVTPTGCPIYYARGHLTGRKRQPSEGPCRQATYCPGSDSAGWTEARALAWEPAVSHSLIAQSRLCRQEALRLPFLCTEKLCLPMYFAFNSKRSSGKTCG